MGKFQSDTKPGLFLLSPKCPGAGCRPRFGFLNILLLPYHKYPPLTQLGLSQPIPPWSSLLVAAAETTPHFTLDSVCFPRQSYPNTYQSLTTRPLSLLTTRDGLSRLQASVFSIASLLGPILRLYESRCREHQAMRRWRIMPAL